MDFTTSLLVALILLITICLYNWLFASWDYWKTRGIPSVPGTLPIVGNALLIVTLQKNLPTLCRSIYEANRDKSMVGFYNMKNPVLMLREPELIKTVLQSSFGSFHDNEMILDLEADPLAGRDIFFTRGQAWKESRAHFVSAFTGKRLKIMSLAVAKVCKQLEGHLTRKLENEDYLEVEAKLLFARYTTEVAANAALSIEGNSFEDDYRGTLLDAIKTTMDVTKMKTLKNNVMLFLPALSKFLQSSLLPKKVDKYFRGLVQDLVDSRQKVEFARDDVLQLMLDLEKEGKIPKIEAFAHTFAFVLETYVTSSLVLSFMCYEVGKHADVQRELRAEIQSVLAKHDGQLTYDAINEMSYMDQVLNETLRLFPPGGALSKLCTKEYRLEGSDGLTLDVAPGTTLIIPVLALHMDPEIWENPEEFNPNRFKKGSDDERHRFTFLPFGEGPRACPGSRLAFIQIKMAIATIVNKYCVELSPKMQDPLPMDATTTLTDCVGGLWIRLRPL